MKRRWPQGFTTPISEDNLRYSQNAPLDMYKEVNTGTNLPAQIDLYSTLTATKYKFSVMRQRRRFRPTRPICIRKPKR
ncbi:Fumarate hydratase class I, aerobic [Raoultella ornithinolytica]|nr:Fumarate hydratase class I, aerobic [Raoultella ornithinolytica]